MKIEGLITLFETTQKELQANANRAINISLIIRNWLFGMYISEFEKGSLDRKELYGKKLINTLSEDLTKRLGKGFSKRSLYLYQRFYDEYNKIVQTVSAQSLVSYNDPKNIIEVMKILSKKFKLTWSHYTFLIGIKNEKERSFYEIESVSECWSLKELKRQFDTGLYERLSLSRDKEGIKKLSIKGQVVNNPQDIIKIPYILEFSGLEEKSKYSENELETAIIDKLEQFLLELGKGFLFESRQKRFTFDDKHFYVDLVFYNRLLKCYVIIDLKIGELKHQDIGQMQMYVNYFDRYVKLEEENPTVGILLCHSKSDDLVELTLPKDSNIHASAYQLYLPSKEELKKQLSLAEQEFLYNPLGDIKLN